MLNPVLSCNKLNNYNKKFFFKRQKILYLEEASKIISKNKFSKQPDTHTSFEKKKNSDICLYN